jgi:selenide,water dikinase
MGPGDLAHVLRSLSTVHHPSLLVGLQVADDAAVWRLDSERALVQTVDFFPPIVDDPYTFGAIAAANAVSDVYAMGAEPFLALAIAAFPADLPGDVLSEVFRGGMDKAHEAGVVIAGGHTITDAEPKYGLAVTGMVHPQRVLTKGAVRPGDLLYLTKPLGTGAITTAAKKDRAVAGDLQRAVSSMLRLNRAAALALADIPNVRACTDVTGYGLLGHASEMAAASRVALEFEAHSVPLLDGALAYAEADLLPGGAERNEAYLRSLDPAGAPRLVVDPSVHPQRLALLFDPQTSGGLLFAAPGADGDAVDAAFARRSQPIWRIGRAIEGHGVRVV